MARFSVGSFAAVAALGIILGVGVWASAQDGGVDAGGQVQADQPLISVHFPGGTVAEYAQLLRDRLRPQPANIALSQAAAGITLPPIDLDAVALGTALGALEYIAPVGKGESWAVQLLCSDPEAYAVTLHREPAPANMMGGPNPPDRLLQVFSIKELIDPPTPGGPNPDTILSAVDLALRMAGSTDGTAPDLKFHQDSGLLILDAPPQQVGAIEALLQRMRDDVFRARDRSERANRDRIDNAMRLRAAEAKMDACGARMEFAQQSLDQMTQMQNSGSASIEDMRNAQVSFVNAKSDRQMAEIELQAVRAKMEQSDAQALPADPGEADALRDEVTELRKQVAILQAKIKELEARKK